LNDAHHCDSDGNSEYAWEWTEGQWRGGEPRALTWKQSNVVPLYEWNQQLSFRTLEEWVENSVEERFISAIQSEVICGSNYITSSLSTVVCDGCFDSSTGSFFIFGFVTFFFFDMLCCLYDIVLIWSNNVISF